jgi:hypothetical protein
MPDPVTNFAHDIQSGAVALANHESGGAYAAIVLSFVLTIYVWYKYGAAAGAPLAASFFICAAMVLPQGPKGT